MKTKLQIFSLLLLGLMMMTVVSADLGTFKQNDCVDLKGSSDTTAMNISSISLPNSTVYAAEQEMTKLGKTFNYTFCATGVLGTYTYDYYDSDGNTWVNSFEITTDGRTNTIGFYLVILLISFGVILLGMYMQDAPIIVFGSLGLYFVGIYTLFNGIEGLRDPVYTWAIGLIILGLAAYISIKGAWEMIGDVN